MRYATALPTRRDVLAIRASSRSCPHPSSSAARDHDVAAAPDDLICLRAQAKCARRRPPPRSHVHPPPEEQLAAFPCPIEAQQLRLKPHLGRFFSFVKGHWPIV